MIGIDDGLLFFPFFFCFSPADSPPYCEFACAASFRCLPCRQRFWFSDASLSDSLSVCPSVCTLDFVPCVRFPFFSFLFRPSGERGGQDTPRGPWAEPVRPGPRAIESTPGTAPHQTPSGRILHSGRKFTPLTRPSINRPINQSINQSINRSIDQSSQTSQSVRPLSNHLLREERTFIAFVFHRQNYHLSTDWLHRLNPIQLMHDG